MLITVKLFAILRERGGIAELQIELADPATGAVLLSFSDTQLAPPRATLCRLLLGRCTQGRHEGLPLHNPSRL